MTARAGKTPLVWFMGVATGLVLTFAAPTALLACVLLAPGMLSRVVDLSENLGTTRAVALAGAAASIRPVWFLWMGGGRMEQSVQLLLDPLTLLLAWGGGALAWALCQVVPAILKVVWDQREAVRAKSLQEEKEALQKEWDF